MVTGSRNTIHMLGVSLGDLAVFHISILVSFALRYAGDIPPNNFNAYTKNALLLSIVFYFSLFICGLYEKRVTSWIAEIEQLAKATGVVALSTVFFVFMSRDFAYPRTVAFISWVILFILLLSWRRFIWAIMTRPLRTSLGIVGPPGELKAVVDDVLSESSAFRLAFAMPIGCKGIPITLPIPVFPGEREGDWHEVLSSTGVDALLITTGTPDGIKQAITLAAMKKGIGTILMPSIYETFLSTSSMSCIGDTPILQLKTVSSSSRELALKRFLDVAIASSVLLLVSPIMLLVTALIKLTSPRGPILHLQERVGYNCKPFVIMKFRTMIPNAEKASGPVFATKDDPRVTPVGRFLRKTRLDELPQFINVLKGEMSIVGPRPERPCFVEQFEADIPGYELRHKVPVGITGLAQVMGGYETSAQNKLTYDVAYATSWSMTSDVKILIKTAGVIMARKGAQ